MLSCPPSDYHHSVDSASDTKQHNKTAHSGNNYELWGNTEGFLQTSSGVAAAGQVPPAKG